MKTLYKGREFSTGDEVTVIYDKDIFETTIDVINPDVIYIYHDNEKYRSGIAERHGVNKKYDKKYYNPININKLDEYNKYILLKKGEEALTFTLSEKLNTFINRHYAKYSFLFNVRLGILDLYDRITESKEKEDNKQGYVVLHSKERKKILRIKLGRLFRKLINEYNKKIGPITQVLPVNDELIEKLHNGWVSFNTEVYGTLVSGKDILKGYTQDNYAKKGHLHSCMTNQFDRLKLYTENPKQINLMIFYYQEEVCGRCLVWRGDDGKLYYDRIYFAFDWVANSIYEILKKDSIQNAKNSRIKITLDKYEVGTTHPYLDTFTYKYPSKKQLANYSLD